MVREALTKIYQKDHRYRLNLPASICRDTAFPLPIKEYFLVRIEGDRLILEPIK